jgi:hypothetical protein
MLCVDILNAVQMAKGPKTCSDGFHRSCRPSLSSFMLLQKTTGLQDTKTFVAHWGTTSCCILMRGSCAFWFCVATRDRHKAEAFWKKQKGALINEDNFFCDIKELSEADFRVMVIQQREGDLVLVPADGPHQGINKARPFTCTSLTDSAETMLSFA